MSGIKIVCKALHHAGKVTIVRRFNYFAELGWAIEEIERSRPRYALAGQALESDSRPISGRRARDGTPVDRVRYRLECDLCTEVVEVRDDRLYAVFEKLRDHLPETGYFTITLDMLRRALSATM